MPRPPFKYVRKYVRTYVHKSLGSQIFAPEVHEIVNGITANFLATGKRMEMPSYKETVIEIAKLTQMENNAKRQKLAVPEKTASAQRKGDEDDQPPASAAPLAVAAPGAMTTKVAASVAEARAVSKAPRAAEDGSSLAGSCGPGQRQQQHLAGVKLADALCRMLDDAPTRPACFGGPLPTAGKLGEGTFATVFRSLECSSSQEAAVKVFHFKDPADAWKRDAAVAEVLAEITYVRAYVRTCVRAYVRGRKALGVHMLSRDPGHLGSPPVPAPPGQSKPALAVFRGKGRRPSHVSRGVCLITTRRRLCLGGRPGWFGRCPPLSFLSFLPSARSYVRTYVCT